VLFIVLLLACTRSFDAGDYEFVDGSPLFPIHKPATLTTGVRYRDTRKSIPCYWLGYFQGIDPFGFKEAKEILNAEKGVVPFMVAPYPEDAAFDIGTTQHKIADGNIERRFRLNWHH
jgi:hypothetical protein